MAAAYVQTIAPTATFNKSAGTTLAATYASTTPVTAGNLIVGFFVFDNAATASKPVVSSISKAAGETANWVFLGAARSTSTSAGAFSSGEIWCIKTTVAWSAVTITLTLDTSVTMKAMDFAEFSGVNATPRSTVGTAYSTTTTAASATTTGTTPQVDDLVVGLMFQSNTPTYPAVDTDTTGGAWVTLTSTGSSGAGGTTNNAGRTCYKILTGASHQTLNSSAAPSAGNGSIVAILQQSPPVAPAARTVSASAGGPPQTAVNLTWADDIAAFPDPVYDIDQSSNGTDFTPRAVGMTGQTGFVVGGLTPNTLYYWRVTGRNSQGSSTSNVVSATTASYPKTETFTEAFTTLSGGIWTTTAGTPTISSGQLQLDCIVSGGEAVQTLASYDLTESSLIMKATPAAMTTGTVRAMRISVYADAQNSAYVEYSSSVGLQTLLYGAMDNSVETAGSQPWNSSTQVYVRMRLSGTALNFDRSPDGGTWTQMGSGRTLSAALVAKLKAGVIRAAASQTGADSTDPAFGLVDNLNVIPVAITQAAYRFYADGTETGSAALAAENTSYTADLTAGDINLLMRVRLQSITAAAVSSTDDFQLQFDKNDNVWVNTPVIGIIEGFNSTNLTDGAATTNRLTAGTGSFVAGKVSEDGLVDDVGWTANNYTELLYAITLKTAGLFNGDTLRLRVLYNDATTGMTFTQTPTINVVKTLSKQGSATGNDSWTCSAVGVKGPGRGSATTTWAEAVSAVGISPVPGVPGARVDEASTQRATEAGESRWLESYTPPPPSAGSAAVSWVEVQTAVGKKTPKGDTTASHTWVTAVAGKRVPKGSAATVYAETLFAAGKRVPKGSTATTYSETLAAAGKRTPKGVTTADHVWATAAAGVKPVVGVKAGSAAVAHGWVCGAVGVASGPPAFSPDEITGLAIWLDASTLGTGSLSSWPNLGSGADAPMVGTPDPVVQGGSLNGKPVVRFRASEGRVRMTGTGVQWAHTLVYVGRMVGPAAGRVITAAYPSPNFFIGYWQGYEDAGYSQTGSFFAPDQRKAWTTDWHMYSSDADASPTFGGTGFYPRLFSDGVLLSSGGTNGYCDMSDAWYDTFNISGYSPTGTEEASDCEVAEVCLYDHKLTDVERVQVEDYLRTKWFSVSGPNEGAATVGWTVDPVTVGQRVPKGDSTVVYAEATSAVGKRTPRSSVTTSWVVRVTSATVTTETFDGPAALLTTGNWTTYPGYNQNMATDGAGSINSATYGGNIHKTPLPPDHWCEIDFTCGNTFSAGVALRLFSTTAGGGTVYEASFYGRTGTNLYMYRNLFTEMGSVSYPLQVGLTYTLRLVAQGGCVSASVNGIPVLTRFDATPLVGGYVAIVANTHSSYVTEFRAGSAAGAIGRETPKADATVAYAEALTVVGTRTPKSDITTTHIWVPAAVGTKPVVGMKQGAGTTTYAFTPVTVGKRAPKAAATVTYTEALVAAGKKVQKGVGTTTYAEAVTSAGKRTPKATATVPVLQTIAATGKRAPQGAASAGFFIYNLTAQGIKPVPGVKQGTAIGNWRNTFVGETPTLPAITGLGLQLDASQLALADGADVFVWPDTSGRGMDVSARVGQDNPPTFKTGIQNGLPVVRFVRANSELLFRATSIGQVAHVFAVCKYSFTTFASYDSVFGGWAELLIIGNQGLTSLYPAQNTPTYYYNGVDSTATRQGPMGEMATLGLSVATPHPNISPVIGSDRFNADRYWDGDICEMLTYDRVLSGAERAQVDSYLNTKWFVPITAGPTGKRTPKGGNTTTAAWACSAVGKKTQRGAATTTYTETPVSVGKRVPKGSKTLAVTFATAAVGKRTPKAVAAPANHSWTMIAQGIRPLLEEKKGNGLVTITWATAAVGRRTPKGAGTGAHTWTQTATGKKVTRGTALTAVHLWTTSAVGKKLQKSAVTVTCEWVLDSEGLRLPKARGDTDYWFSQVAVGSNGIEAYWNGEYVTALYWGDQPVLDWMMVPS